MRESRAVWVYNGDFTSKKTSVPWELEIMTIEGENIHMGYHLWMNTWNSCSNGFVFTKHLCLGSCNYCRSGNFHVYAKIIVVLSFYGFVRSAKFFLMVDDCNIDERLESSRRLVYYQVSGEPGIAGCDCPSAIYFGGGGWLVHKLIHWSSWHNFVFHVLNFRSWSQTRNFPDLRYCTNLLLQDTST